jgi:hypothetical protein
MLSLTWGMPLAMITTLVFCMARLNDVGDALGGLVLAGAGVMSYGALATLVTGLTLRWVLERPAATQGNERGAGGSGRLPADFEADLADWRPAIMGAAQGGYARSRNNEANPLTPGSASQIVW